MESDVWHAPSVARISCYEPVQSDLINHVSSDSMLCAAIEGKGGFNVLPGSNGCCSCFEYAVSAQQVLGSEKVIRPQAELAHGANGRGSQAHLETSSDRARAEPAQKRV